MTSGWIEIRSPLRTRFTSRPVSSTSAENSCPRILRQHCACKFVWTGGRNDRSASEFVQVRAADAACQRLDEHLGVAERIRRWNVFDANVLLGVEPHRFHLFPSLSVYPPYVKRRAKSLTATSAGSPIGDLAGSRFIFQGTVKRPIEGRCSRISRRHAGRSRTAGFHAQPSGRACREGEQPRKFPHYRLSGATIRLGGLRSSIVLPGRSHIAPQVLPRPAHLSKMKIVRRKAAFDNRQVSRDTTEIFILRIFSDVGSSFSGSFRSQRRWVGNDRYGLRKGCDGAKRPASE